MKFDLHMHTTRHSPDSEMDPFALVCQARKVGLDGVVITEHDWLWTNRSWPSCGPAAPNTSIPDRGSCSDQGIYRREPGRSRFGLCHG